MDIGICIKRHLDEDDLNDFENEEIELIDIKIYKIGDESIIHPQHYNKDYWKIKQ